MKSIRVIIVSMLALFLSDCKTNSTIIEFDEYSFELPLKVKKAKEIFSLDYGYYIGFYRGNLIKTQIENNPLFLGSDNDKEEIYYNKYIVGVTFFKESKTLNQIKNEFEQQYNKKFKTEIKNYSTTSTLPPYKLIYHYIKTKQGVFIAIKEVEPKLKRKENISISFYKGISQSELEKYLEHVN